jgi:hypothetical protein
LEEKSSGSGIEYRDYGFRDPSSDPATLYPQKLLLIWPTSGGRFVGIVRSWTKVIELPSLMHYNSKSTRLLF